MNESKIVPREPTEAMIGATDSRTIYKPNASPADARIMAKVWRAMYDAAPPTVPDAPPIQGDDAGLCSRLRRIASGEWVLKGDEGYLVQAAARIEQLAAESVAHARDMTNANAMANRAYEKEREIEWLSKTLRIIREQQKEDYARAEAAQSLVAQQKERIAELEKALERLLDGPEHLLECGEGEYYWARDQARAALDRETK